MMRATGPLTVEVIEYGMHSPASRYCESFAYDADTDPMGDHMGNGPEGPGCLPRAIARAIECGASTIIVRPLPPRELTA